LFLGLRVKGIWYLNLSKTPEKWYIINMEAVQTVEHPTFESVWAGLQEVRQILKDNAEQQKESAKEWEERHKETDQIVKEVGKRLGDFTNSFGNVVQHMIAPNLQEKFGDLGYDFQEISTRHKVRDKKNNIFFEVDVFLQNGDYAMLVEIKSDLSIGDINKHITRLEKMRKYADLRGDKRHFLGAVAGIVVEDDEKEYALSQGFFLIEPTGENFNITSPTGKPKEW
jgi:hypothetical protein